MSNLLITKNGKEIQLKEIGLRQDKGVTKVYNITVDGDHTYFVTKKEILVHNKSALL